MQFAALAKEGDQLLHRLWEAEIVECHRPHIEDDLADARQTFANLAAQLFECFLRLRHVLIHQALDNGRREQAVREILCRAVVDLARDAVALLLGCLDDACTDKFVLLHCLDLPQDTADLRTEIADDRADGECHVLCPCHDLQQVTQADLELVALDAEGLLLLALDRKVDLDDGDCLVGLADLVLRVLRELLTDLCEPQPRAPLILGQPVHAVDGLTDPLLQLCEAAACLLHLGPHILIDVKDLRFIIFNGIDRIGQQSAQVPLFGALCGRLIRHGTIHPPFFRFTHRILLSLCALLYPICREKSRCPAPLAFSAKNR